jgi:hypothetical protein
MTPPHRNARCKGTGHPAALGAAVGVRVLSAVPLEEGQGVQPAEVLQRPADAFRAPVPPAQRDQPLRDGPGLPFAQGPRGTPATIDRVTSRVTTAPAATTAPCPTVTSGLTTAPCPIQVSCPIRATRPAPLREEARVVLDVRPSTWKTGRGSGAARRSPVDGPSARSARRPRCWRTCPPRRWRCRRSGRSRTSLPSRPGGGASPRPTSVKRPSGCPRRAARARPPAPRRPASLRPRAP